MLYFFSRRSFSKNKFTDNPAQVTRFVGVKDANSTPDKNSNMKQSVWADRVISKANGHGVLVYVHGFNTSQAHFLTNLQKVKSGVKEHGFKGEVIGFDWPTGHSGSLFKLPGIYKTARSNVHKISKYLGLDGLNAIWTRKPSMDVHVLAHSMGAYLVINGFSHLGDQHGDHGTPWRLKQAVFVAADTYRDWLEKGGGGALIMGHRSQRFTNFYSTKDLVLSTSSGGVNIAHPRAGHKGIAPYLTSGFHDVSMTKRYDALYPKPKHTVMASHNWFFDDDIFYQDIALTLAGKSAENMITRKPWEDGDQRLVV